MVQTLKNVGRGAAFNLRVASEFISVGNRPVLILTGADPLFLGADHELSAELKIDTWWEQVPNEGLVGAGVTGLTETVPFTITISSEDSSGNLYTTEYRIEVLQETKKMSGSNFIAPGIMQHSCQTRFTSRHAHLLKQWWRKSAFGQRVCEVWAGAEPEK